MAHVASFLISRIVSNDFSKDNRQFGSMDLLVESDLLPGMKKRMSFKKMKKDYLGSNLAPANQTILKCLFLLSKAKSILYQAKICMYSLWLLSILENRPATLQNYCFHQQKHLYVSTRCLISATIAYRSEMFQ